MRADAKISIGSGGNPALRCSECEKMICDDVLGMYPDHLIMLAGDHRCDEVEQVQYFLEKAQYERDWRKGKDGQ